MIELEVAVYFQTAFETHKFTVNREADITHVISFDSLLFNLDVDSRFYGRNKKMGNFFSTRENNSTSVTSVRLCWFSLSCHQTCYIRSTSR